MLIMMSGTHYLCQSEKLQFIARFLVFQDFLSTVYTWHFNLNKWKKIYRKNPLVYSIRETKKLKPWLLKQRNYSSIGIKMKVNLFLEKFHLLALPWIMIKALIQLRFLCLLSNHCRINMKVTSLNKEWTCSGILLIMMEEISSKSTTKLLSRKSSIQNKVGSKLNSILKIEIISKLIIWKERLQINRS